MIEVGLENVGEMKRGGVAGVAAWPAVSGKQCSSRTAHCSYFRAAGEDWCGAEQLMADESQGGSPE